MKMLEDLEEVVRNDHEKCPNFWAAIEFIRTHHATIRDMAARLEAAERDVEKWISVDDKLPDIGMAVWLYGDGGIFIGGRSYVGGGEWGWCNSYNQFWRERDGSWSADLEYDDDYHVTHWKLLPELPSIDAAMQETGR